MGIRDLVAYWEEVAKTKGFHPVWGGNYLSILINCILHRFILRRYLKEGRVLEIGCGVGRITRWLAFRRQRHIIGVDISKNMVLRAKYYLKAFENVDLIVADVRKLPFRQKSFDQTISVATLECLECYEDFCMAMRDITYVTKSEITIIEKPVNVGYILGYFSKQGFRCYIYEGVDPRIVTNFTRKLKPFLK